jgi:hypothetical protein
MKERPQNLTRDAIIVIVIAISATLMFLMLRSGPDRRICGGPVDQLFGACTHVHSRMPISAEFPQN